GGIGERTLTGGCDAGKRGTVERNPRVPAPEHRGHEVWRIDDAVRGRAIVLCRPAAMVDATVIRPVVPAYGVARIPDVCDVVDRLNRIEIEPVAVDQPGRCSQL